VWVLGVWGGSAVLAALTASALARGDDPDRTEYRATVVETGETGTTGTGGTAPEQAQLKAYWSEFSAARKSFLTTGRTTLDVVLETERFLWWIDYRCGATPSERMAASRASLTRLREIRAVIGRASLRQVENAQSMVEIVLRKDTAEARGQQRKRKDKAG